MDQGPIVRRVEPAFQDERGDITNVLEENINHVAIITSAKGSVRGNHYHPIQEQWIYVVEGTMRVWVQNVDKPELGRNYVIGPGDLEYMPPVWAHAYEALSDVVFLNLTTGPRDAEDYKEHTKQFEVRPSD